MLHGLAHITAADACICCHTDSDLHLPTYFRFARAFSPRFLGAKEVRVALELLA